MRIVPATKTQALLPGVVLLLKESFRCHRWLQALSITVASGLGFGVLMKLTLVLLFGNGIAVCWPMVGIMTAVMLRIPRQHWPWLLTGMTIGHLLVEKSSPVKVMAVDTICDVVELIITAAVLPAFNGLSDWIKQPNLLVRFVIWPVVLAPALTSIPVGLVFSHGLHSTFWSYAAMWCFADALGVVLWLPLALVLFSPETYALFKRSALPRTAKVLGSLAIASAVIFYSRPLPTAFILLPVLLLVALRLGFSGSVLAVNMLSILGTVATFHGHGPFGMMNDAHRVMTLQIFLTFGMLTCFPISIVLLERDSFEKELHEAYRRMEQLAILDGLTGLANRRQFDTVLDAEWRRALRARHSVGLLMIDVDCFKLFNDSYGHLAGDECLRKVAKTIAGAAQRTGDLVGRYGGEEFFVLLPRTDMPGVLKVAERVRRETQAIGLEHKGNAPGVVTVSIGCWTVVPNPDRPQESLVQSADLALYAAKRNGRNRVEAFHSQENALAQSPILTASARP